MGAFYRDITGEGRKERPVYAEGLQWKNIERVKLVLGKGRLEDRRTF